MNWPNQEGCHLIQVNLSKISERDFFKKKFTGKVFLDLARSPHLFSLGVGIEVGILVMNSDFIIFLTVTEDTREHFF